ncbi:MAG: hypothetical protein AB7N99_06870 [Simkaniaceae bacterium]
MSNIPLWLRGFANPDHLSYDPQERIEMNSQCLVAAAHSIGTLMGQAIDELRTLGSIDSFVSSDGKITLQFDRTVSEKIEGFLNEHLPNYGHIERFHFVQQTSDVMTSLTIDVFAMPFFARFLGAGTHSLHGRSVMSTRQGLGLAAKSPGALSEQRVFLERMNHPAFRSGIARESQNISRGLSDRAIAKLEGRISNWLGEETRLIRNPEGDLVFLSKDGTRRVRFDFNRTRPHDNPHCHVEIKINGKWDKSGPIYPIDVPHK